ncbi:MAG TPA: hypothetical protein VFB59_03925 [Candidatus Saccharimonadales bacterium]|nr:hypothetical protein [Candidatus Saccharimonadales bacterium]
MPALVEQFRLEAPAVLWRGIGSLASLAITNSEYTDPTPQLFDGTLFNTWTKGWADEDEGKAYSLKVRETLAGHEGPATLFIVESVDQETGLQMYTRYFFPADPNCQEDVGYLAVFRGSLDPKGTNQGEVQAQQIIASMELGTAVGTILDLSKLSAELWQGMIILATQASKG